MDDSMSGMKPAREESLREGCSLRASSTIEAALLMPILLAVICMLVFLTLFLYTRASFVRNGYAAVLRGSQAEGATRQARRQIAEREFERLAKACYNGSVSCQADYGGKGEILTIRITLRQKLPQIMFGGERLPDLFSEDLTLRAVSCHPVAFIRTCRRLRRAQEAAADP